jgi:hypothetical protein
MNLDIINILDNEYFGTLPSSQENENNIIISDESNFIDFSNIVPDFPVLPKNIIIADKIESIENIKLNKKKILFKVKKNVPDTNRKPGRKTKSASEKSKEISDLIGVHGNKDFDNLERKIQVHYIRFIINFSNDALKAENISKCYKFKQIDTSIKETINYIHVKKLRQSSIGDIIQKDISNKYKRYDKSENRKIFKKVVASSEWLRELFMMNYLELFNYYYNQEKPLKKLVFKNKEISLSTETESFFDLLEKYDDIRNELINTVDRIYYNDNSQEISWSNTDHL